MPAAFAITGFCFGNRVLTIPGAWWEAGNRVSGPCFDTLAGDAGLGFGQAPHAKLQDVAQDLASVTDVAWRANAKFVNSADSRGDLGYLR